MWCYSRNLIISWYFAVTQSCGQTNKATSNVTQILSFNFLSESRIRAEPASLVYSSEACGVDKMKSEGKRGLSSVVESSELSGAEKFRWVQASGSGGGWRWPRVQQCGAETQTASRVAAFDVDRWWRTRFSACGAFVFMRFWCIAVRKKKALINSLRSPFPILPFTLQSHKLSSTVTAPSYRALSLRLRGFVSNWNSGEKKIQGCLKSYITDEHDYSFHSCLEKCSKDVLRLSTQAWTVLTACYYKFTCSMNQRPHDEE